MMKRLPCTSIRIASYVLSLISCSMNCFLGVSLSRADYRAVLAPSGGSYFTTQPTTIDLGPERIGLKPVNLRISYLFARRTELRNFRRP